MSRGTKWLFLFLGAVTAPIAEEVFFRGFLFGMFWRAGRICLGILFTSLLFAAAHISDAYNTPALLLIGICLAWLYYRTRSLVAPIVAHVLNNGIGISLLFFE
jgi:membrane protease YdiL (CAAX protease family)